jgi:glycosyltransferase involved in cell wall biosynthesis
MKIGIEGFSFQKHPAGIGRYITSLLRLLIDHYPEAEFIVYSNKDVFLPEEILRKVRIKQDKGVFRYLSTTIWLKTMGSFFIRSDQLDFYFSAAGLLPFLSKKTKTIAVVHDLNYRIVPETMGRLLRLSHQAFLKKDIHKADFLVVNSKGTAEKAAKYLNRRADAIINPPIDRNLFKPSTPACIHMVRQKYGISDPYFFTVGTLEPRKNLQLTIKVFLKFIERPEYSNYKLLVAGAKGWREKKILELCDTAGEHLIRLGYVDEQDLPALYSGSKAFLFPSIYEGFGMPAREALLCGCTVITSDIIELRESCYNRAIFIPVSNFDAYLKALFTVAQGVEPVLLQSESSLANGEISPFIDFFKTNPV